MLTSPTTPTFQQSSSHSSLLRNSPPLQITEFEGSPLQKRAFEFFYVKAVPLLSGYFYGEFFSDGLLQIGFLDPAVRHGIIAFSAVFENEFVKGTTSEPTGEADTAFAIEAYNLAIRHLLRHLGNQQDNVLVPLMTCILFVCIDCVRHDVVGAMGHIKGGLKLLETFRSNTTGQLSCIPRPQQRLFREVVVPVFSWLSMTGTIFGSNVNSPADLVGEETQPLEVSSKPDNIDQALSSFFEIVARFINFARVNARARYSPTRDPAVAIENLRILNQIDIWKSQLDELLKTVSLPRMEVTGVNLIKAAFKAIRMWIESFLYPSESIWDGYKHEYEQILDLVSSALHDSVRFPDQASKSFAFEMPMIPLLHFVAMKCRWPHLRRQAIEYLGECPQRECMFTSRYSILVAEKVMEIEELGLPVGRNRIPVEDCLPPESNRVYHLDFPPLAESRHGRAVNFMTKPRGISNPWSIKTEYINVKSIELLRWFDLTGKLEDHAPEVSQSGILAGGGSQNMVMAQC